MCQIPDKRNLFRACTRSNVFDSPLARMPKISLIGFALMESGTKRTHFVEIQPAIPRRGRPRRPVSFGAFVENYKWGGGAWMGGLLQKRRVYADSSNHIGLLFGVTVKGRPRIPDGI